LNLLLDTHVALWAITDHPRLSSRARALIESAEADVWVSVVSLWEIAIKHSLGRGDMPVSARDAVRFFQQAGYRLLPIEAEHVLALESLASHHQDPFDRLLVAQALAEPLRLMTHDPIVAKYSEAIERV
jgi:PIN domain nuclease of toxin-antitoxin system